MQKKAGLTVEAALLCPFLCLVLCGMILFSLQLYQRVDAYAEELADRERQEWETSMLIRLEAVTENMF